MCYNIIKMEDNYYMNDINHKIIEAQSNWNNRLYDQMNKKGCSQTGLAKELNINYNDSSTQTTIYRWLHVGEKLNGAKGFPTYENMMKIADFFNVDVGYLTGETDAESFTIEKAADFLGLSIDATNAIKDFTNKQSGITKNKIFSRNYIEMLNLVLTSKSFKDVLVALHDYKEAYEMIQKEEPDFFYELKEKYSPQVIEIATKLDEIPYYKNNSEYKEYKDEYFTEGLPELTEELRSALADIQFAFNNVYKWQYEQEQYRKNALAYRYELQEAVTKLLDSIFPPINN